MAMSSSLNPYVDWLELPDAVSRPNYYELLGVELFEDNERNLKGAYYRRVARVSVYQSGANAEACKNMLVELAEARDCLVDPESRQKYDQLLRRKQTRSPGTRPQGSGATARSASTAAASAVGQTQTGRGGNSNRPGVAGQVAASIPKRSSRPVDGRNGGPAKPFDGSTHDSRRSDNQQRQGLGAKVPIEFNRARSPFDMLSVMRTPEEILSEIVQTRGLSPYQAKRFMESEPEELVLGPYLLENELMGGAWGQVFTATRISTGELVSLRVLPPTFKSDLSEIKNFIRKSKAVPSKRFQKPIDCAQKDRIYLASEYIAGEDLASLVARRGSLPTAQAVYAAARIVENMANAQKAKLLHLELRPSKILVNRSGEVFIRDLALANAVSQRKRHQSNPGQMAQVLPPDHLHYLAPEVFLSESIPSFQSDIYSIGCILYFLLTGRPVFENEDPFRIVLAHREAAVPSLLEFDSTLPDSLDHCVRRMLAKKPGNRFTSYGQLHQNLKQIYLDLGVSSVSPRVLWKDVEEVVQTDIGKQPGLRRVRFGRAAILAAAASLLIGAGVVAAKQFSSPSTPNDPEQASAPEPARSTGPEILRSGSSTVPEVEAVDSFEIR